MSAQMNDHQEAVKNLMAERYLLGELNAGEREAYEEHLFSCDACFEQVKAGTEFVSHLRRIGAEEPAANVAPPRWAQSLRSMLRPAPAFALAACILAGTSLYQNMITIPMLKGPQVELRFNLTEQNRGSSVVKAPRNSRIHLAVEFRHTQEFGFYEAHLQTSDGKAKWTVPFLPSQDTIELSIYAGTLQPGKYVLVVWGRDGDSRQELARDPFTVQFTD
jgi:putative zinc finger protein